MHASLLLQSVKRLEIYKLVDGDYRLQIGEPYWMSEIGLGIGRFQGLSGGIPQAMLGWFNQKGDRYTSEERAELLVSRLRELGEDPDQI